MRDVNYSSPDWREFDVAKSARRTRYVPARPDQEAAWRQADKIESVSPSAAIDAPIAAAKNLYLQVRRLCNKMVKYSSHERTVGKTSFKGETQNEKTTAHVHMRGICGELCSIWTEQRNC